MKAVGALLAIAALLVLAAAPASAQAKDPFQPPAGAGGAGGSGDGGAAPAGDGGVFVPQPPGGGNLPRTGLDYSLPVLAAAVFLVLGASMRVAGRALAP